MYHPTTRLLTILELLQSHPLLSGAEMARRLEVQERTVRRYIVMLQDMGIPIETTRGPGGGYSLRPGFKLPPLMFTEEEATAIVLGLLGSAWLEIDQSPAAVEGALAKILRVLPVRAREQLTAVTTNVIFSPYDQTAHPNTSLMLQLTGAAQEQIRVEISYRSQRDELTQRVVEPYSLAGWWGAWYLVGYCCLRQDFRLFRLDRINQLTTLNEQFELADSFDSEAYVVDQLSKVSDGWEIKLEFSSPLYTVQQKLPAHFGTLTDSTNGILFECNHADLHEFARYLISLDLPFSVHQPPELRDALQKLAEQILQIAK